MGIFTRFSDIVNSNINAILDKAEDPEKIVRLMIQEMEDTLVEVRSAAARSIADKKDLNRKLESLESELRDWEEKAELAVRKGRDDLAKAALVEKSRVQSAADAVKADYAAVDEGLTKLNEDIVVPRGKLVELVEFCERLQEDGVLLGLTYVRAHEVAGWHRHTFSGDVESIAVIPGDGYDQLWQIVNGKPFYVSVVVRKSYNGIVN